MNNTVKELEVIHSGKKIRLMFQDEAGFGRINMCPARVEPLTGDGCFLIMPYCNTVCMNIFLKQLSERYSEDIILLCCDGAAWHKSGGLQLPENIILFHIPPYTPEMNPIEQIWKEIRKRGFRNEIFATLEKVVDRLRDTICSLFNNVISSITGREWIIEVFNLELVSETESSSAVHKNRAGDLSPTRLAIICVLSLPQLLT